MTRFLHSNWFFVISVTVLISWAVFLTHPAAYVKVIECPHRVSARGVVHSPDSPWWGLTSSDPCFRTEAAARAYARGVRE
jgi:hypothetical protein